MLHINLQDLYKELGGIIRMMEDAVLRDDTPHVYLLVGKLSMLQAKIDERENNIMEWSNENGYEL